MATPLFQYIEPWHWDTSNDGWATAEETQQSYSALINKTRTNLFLMKVWNDMVLTVGYFRNMTERSWNTYYGTESDTYMRDGFDQLTANRFNALVVNVGYPRYSWQFEPTLESYIGRETFKGVAMVSANYADIVYAAYFIEIMQKLNILIAVCNGNIERCELAWQEHRALNISSDAVALPSAPIAYNLMIESDVESATELSIQALQPFRVQHTDTLNLHCTLSVILGGFARIEILFELFYVFPLTPLPSRRLICSNSASHSVFGDIATLLPFYDWSVNYQVGESSYEADMVALPIAYFEYSEEIPDIPIVATLATSKAEAMDMLFRMSGVFDFGLTVRRTYNIEIALDAASLRIDALIEHGRFSYMAGPLFITSTHSTKLDACKAALLEATANTELLLVNTLDLIVGRSLTASVEAFASFNTRGNRGISISLNNHIDFTSSVAASLERYNRPISAYCNIYDYIVSYSTLDKSTLLCILPTFDVNAGAILEASLQLYDDAIQLSAGTIGTVETASNILFVSPQLLRAKSYHTIESTAAIDLTNAVHLAADSVFSESVEAHMSIEGAAWLYPIQTDNDLYIRQVVRAEKHSDELSLDGRSVYVAGATYGLLVLDNSLEITNVYYAASMLDRLLLSCTLDMLRPWVYPVVTGTDIYIQQVTDANKYDDSLHIEHCAVLLTTTLAQELISPSQLEVFSGLEVSQVFTGAFSAPLIVQYAWHLPVVKGTDVYISHSMAVRTKDNDMEVS